MIVALEDILDSILTIYADITFQVSFLSTSPGTLTGINTKNYRLYQKREREIEKIKESLQDIKSQNTKLV